MPFYDYKCKKCGYEIKDLKKSIKDNSKEICPKCNEEMLLIISNSYFELKGDGWFKDGYNKK